MRLRAAGVALLCLLLTACATAPPAPPHKPRRMPPPPQQQMPRVSRTPGLAPDYVPGAAPLSERDRGPALEEIPEGIELTPDAVPVDEPRSRSGNSPEYQVFGETYRTLGKAGAFRERGHASWYGKKFHGRKTASGEIYNMFKMTAAHKTLPLPSYVRVTNLANGKSTVVRVNDRGPFHKGRIIDLSYAAAAKLDIIDHGAMMVEIEAVTAGDTPVTAVADAGTAAPAAAVTAPAIPPPAPRAEVRAAPPTPQGWLQIASFIDPINAVSLREELQGKGFVGTSVITTDLGGETLHRVVAGPFHDEASSLDLRRRLRGHGYAAEWMSQ
ncbi:septal ring lytic transglycosylase RlpA family protein [Solimonas sp. K1W22B-7]|uniref:septal ring lytic transglycosylase RlpA family protein n=1 Tax=Solimonas sp. K1W22B-7 TaxID=2303331 RepID=UPI0013C45339|nr:septal ring lytic transglycosylase RlpA family protein [Solimonas sp. K1W22B-7]